MERLRRLDREAVLHLNALANHSAWTRRVVGVAAFWLPAVEIALTILLGLSGRWLAAARVFTAVAVVYAATAAAGRGLRRNRPFVSLEGIAELVGHGPHRSFPSRHVASAVAMSSVAGASRPALGRLMAAVAWALAFARVGAGLHYPSDVAAGALVGLVVGRVMRHP